jgi:hypothetical protein
MVRLGVLVALVMLWSFSGGALAQTPEWSLSQNAPEPFCNDEGGGGTAIQFTVLVQAHVSIEVWDAGMTSVVRSLVDGFLEAGVHMVVWDGRDSLGVRVPNGEYPYRMTATDAGETGVLFDDAKVAHVQCDTPVSGETWSAIKALYRS